MIKLFSKQLLLGLVIALTNGCCLHTSFRLKNESGEAVYVYSAHTRKTNEVSKNAAENIPHTCGAVSIKTESGKNWSYPDIDVLAPDTRWLKHGRRGFFTPSVTLNLLLERDGRLFLLPPDGGRENYHRASQPVGFPLCPTTTVK